MGTTTIRICVELRRWRHHTYPMPDGSRPETLQAKWMTLGIDANGAMHPGEISGWEDVYPEDEIDEMMRKDEK